MEEEDEKKRERLKILDPNTYKKTKVRVYFLIIIYTN